MVDYKLRLGDGTTFSVDEKGLTTWLQGGLVDDKARVQPAGSKKWFTLKQVLAAQGEQRGHAVRQTEKGRADVDRQAAEETAAIERRVAEQRATEERKAAEELSAAERKAAEDRNAAERKLIEEREAAERYVAEEAAEAAARAAEESRRAAERVEAERRASEEKAAAERTEAQAAEAARVAEAERSVAIERAERAERKRKADEARAETERQAAETARLEAEAREVAARDAAARSQVEAERVAEAERKVAAERAERAERKRRADAEKVAAEKLAAENAAAEKTAAEKIAAQNVAAQKVAAEKAAAEKAAAEKIAAEKVAAAKVAAERAAAERLAAERIAAERAAAERLAAERRAAERETEVDAFHVEPSDPPATAIAAEPAASMVNVEDFERELGLVPVAIDDGAGSAVTAAARGDVVSPARVPGEEGADGAPSTAIPETPAAIVKTLIRFFEVLERAVTRVAGLFRRAAPVEPPPVGVAVVIAPTAPHVPPASVLVSSVAVSPPAAPAISGPPAAATSALPPWAAPPTAPWTPPAAKAVAVTTPREAVRRPPAMPPPSFKDVEVIPFATAPTATRPAEEMWDGADEVWQEPSRISSTLAGVWRWTVRGLVLTALVGAAFLLALNREKWIPQAQDAATVLGQNVDKLSERASTRTVSPQAIEAARAQIPYLRPQTIELVLSKSPVALEPAEVFRRAHVAAERARPGLPTHVAAEIDTLTGAAAAALDAAEGERLRGYFESLRSGTATAAYQDKDAIWLMSRGVRRLSGEQLARMEQLFADAIAAGLTPSPAP